MDGYIGRKVRMVCEDPIAGRWRHGSAGEVGIEAIVVAEAGAGILLAEATHTFEVERPDPDRPGGVKTVERTETVKIGVAAAYFQGAGANASSDNEEDEETL